MAIVWPSLQIAPHPLAPTFSAERDPNELLRQLAAEVTSQNFHVTERILKLLAEAGVASLWFYLKYIAGTTGPYNLLNSELHVDMCNFRQRVATEPGIKAAIMVPRSTYKSTICSHGANAWELVRNPNLRVGCTSQIYDRALSFVQTTIGIFTENDLHKALYPAYVKENKSNVELILANRTRTFPEPNLMAITAGGSTQGIHVDVFNADDIVGEDMLNADHASGAEMARMGNWLYSNLRTLVVSWTESRVMVVGTRYAVDDPYEKLMHEGKEHLGYWKDMEAEYPLDVNGDWIVYYRSAKQYDDNNVPYSINPTAYTVEQLDKLAESEPWVYQSQYANNPLAAGASDFASYSVRDILLEWDEMEETYFINRSNFDGTYSKVDIRYCDVVLAGDPSGGETRASYSASRASVALIARDKDSNIYLLEAESGFVLPTKFFDWLFRLKGQYSNFVRQTYVEAQAGFKSFVPIIRKEEASRNKYLNLLGIPALGDKETTIRNIIQPVLEKGKLYVRKEIRGKLMEELRVFPSKRMDLLDALKIAIYKSVAPNSSYGPADEDDDRPREKHRKVSRVTGY